MKKHSNRKNMLLIGGTGGIGQALMRVLDSDKYDILALGPKDTEVTNLINMKACGDLLHPDIIVNLAGIISFKRLDEEDESIKEMIDVNCLGAVNTLYGFLPGMEKRGYGRIIMMSSIFSDITIKGCGVYSATKAFVDKVVKVAAIEVAGSGVTVNSIKLGYTGLGMGDVDNKTEELVLRKVGLGRYCFPIEIAQTIDYIVETEYLTGQSIRLDGGIK